MTMPLLHNCKHSPDGWCLSCVADLSQQHATITSTLPRDRNGVILTLGASVKIRDKEDASIVYRGMIESLSSLMVSVWVTDIESNPYGLLRNSRFKAEVKSYNCEVCR